MDPNRIVVRYEVAPPAPINSAAVPSDPTRMDDYNPDMPFRVISFNGRREFGIKMSNRYLTAWDDTVVTIAKDQWPRFMAHPELGPLLCASKEAPPHPFDYVNLRTKGQYKYVGYDRAEKKSNPIESILVLPGGKLEICWPITPKIEVKKDEMEALKSCKRRINVLEKELTEANAKRSRDSTAMETMKKNNRVLKEDNKWMEKELGLLSYVRGNDPPPEVKEGFVQYWVDTLPDGQGPAPPAPPVRRQRTPSASPVRRQRTPSSSPVRRQRTPPAPPVRRQRTPASPARRQRTPPASPIRRQRTPSAPLVHRQRTPPASPVRRQRTPPASPVRRQRTPPASPVRRQRNPPASPVRHRRTPPAPSVRRQRTPSTSPVRRQRTPPAPPVCRQRTSPVPREAEAPAPRKPTPASRVARRRIPHPIRNEIHDVITISSDDEEAEDDFEQ